MSDVRQWLREADPFREEAVWPLERRDAVRRRVIVAAREEPSTSGWRPRPFLVAATVAIAIVAGAVAGGRILPRAMRGPDARAIVPPTPHERRQLQFATRGGTRIIWVFNSDFDL